MSTSSTNGSRRAQVQFGESDLHTKHGLEQWKEQMGHALLRLDLELLADRPFQSSVRVQTIPRIMLARAAMSGLKMVRSRAMISDGNDCLSLHIGMGGPWTIHHRRRELRLDASVATLVANDEVAEVTCPALARSTCVNFSRTELSHVVTNLDDKLMRPSPPNTAALQLLIGYLELLDARTDLVEPELGGVVATHILDLIALTLGATRDAAEVAQGRGARAAKWRTIEADVRANARDPSLTLASVARRHSVSARYVQLLFESAGTTFSTFVLANRLALAHSSLQSARMSTLTISSIAFDSGFSDISYFNRTFRRRYGCSPSDVRASVTTRARRS